MRFVLPSHGRSVVRYRQVLDETLALDARQCAVLAVLLLRGPQTIGELRIRTERMATFDSLEEVEHELDLLQAPGRSRWPTTSGGGPGRRRSAGPRRWSPLRTRTERRWTVASGATAAPTAATPRRLRAELAELRAEVADLRREVQELRESLGG